MSKEIVTSKSKNALQALSSRLQVDPESLKATLKATAFQECKTDAQFIAAVIIANTYGLNPLLKEIYAFPSQKGVVPMVPVDGWISLVNRHARYNGVELIENEDPEGKQPGGLKSVTAKFYLKDTEHPVVVTEYMAECYNGSKEPWKKWPRRMLRHKAYIQGARIAFGFSGIYDEDEAQRIAEAQVVESVAMKPDVEMPRAKNIEPVSEVEETQDVASENEALPTVETLLSLTVNSKMPQLIAPLVTATSRNVKKRDGKVSVVTDYVVGHPDVPATISAWGSAIEAESGNVLEFRDIIVSEYNGELKFTAREVIKN